MRTRFFAEKYRQWGVIPRSRFICEIGVEEPSNFGMIFSTATSKLKDWYDQNTWRAQAFELRLCSNPLVLQRARTAMQILYGSDDTYAFVKKLAVCIVFQDQISGKIERFNPDQF